MAQDPIEELRRSFREESGQGASSRAEFERLKGRYLGRDKGLLPALFAKLKELPPAERGAFGKRLNAAKTRDRRGASGACRKRSRPAKPPRATTPRRWTSRCRAAGRAPGASTRSRSFGGRSRTSSCGWATRSPTARRSRTTSTTSRRSTSRRSTRRATRRTRCSLDRNAVSPAAPAHAHLARPDPRDAAARRAAADHRARARVPQGRGRRDALARLPPGRGPRRGQGHLDGGPEGHRVGAFSRSSSGRARRRASSRRSSPSSSPAWTWR